MSWSKMQIEGKNAFNMYQNVLKKVCIIMIPYIGALALDLSHPRVLWQLMTITDLYVSFATLVSCMNLRQAGLR